MALVRWHRASDYELAQRLALFLWSSIPDESLMDAVRKGELRNVRDA